MWQARRGRFNKWRMRVALSRTIGVTVIDGHLDTWRAVVGRDSEGLAQDDGGHDDGEKQARDPEGDVDTVHSNSLA
jgi:hypothetical protein